MHKVINSFRLLKEYCENDVRKKKILSFSLTDPQISGRKKHYRKEMWTHKK